MNTLLTCSLRDSDSHVQNYNRHSSWTLRATCSSQIDISVHHVPFASSSPVLVPTHVCVRVPNLVRRLFSQCSGLIRRGATRLTSVLESCGTPRGDSTYPPLPDLGGCWGWWWVREHVGVEPGFRAESSRILRKLYSATFAPRPGTCVDGLRSQSSGVKEND